MEEKIQALTILNATFVAMSQILGQKVSIKIQNYAFSKPNFL